MRIVKKTYLDHAAEGLRPDVGKGDIMFRKRKEEHKVVRCWVLFNREAYFWSWVYGKIPAVFGRFVKDLRYCRQRIVQGYCDEDLLDMTGWFFEVVPNMLERYKQTRRGSPCNLGENYTDERGFSVNYTCHREWDEILDRIIFLFREADETTCQRKNPYEDEHRRVCEEFREKYGLFGKELETPEQRESGKRTGYHTVHFPSEIPEYADIEKNYKAEWENLMKYQEQCKNDAFQLFSEWFFQLWS